MVPEAKLQVVQQQQLLTFCAWKEKEFSTVSMCAVCFTADIWFSHLHFHHPVQWLRLWGRLLSGDGPSGPQCGARHWRVLLQLWLPGWRQLQPSPARLSPGQRLPLWRGRPRWVPVHRSHVVPGILYFNCRLSQSNIDIGDGRNISQKMDTEWYWIFICKLWWKH